jgi:hypothetical protein
MSLTNPRSRRGSDFGPKLTPRTAVLGMPVRVTASTGLMAGAHGVITNVLGSRVSVKFGEDTHLCVPMERLQIADHKLTPAQYDIVHRGLRSPLGGLPVNVRIQGTASDLAMQEPVQKNDESFPMFRADARWNI